MPVDAFEYLFSLQQFGVKFGLDNMRTIVARLDHPELAFDSVHVGGTNGKGSVTAMVEAAVRAAGLKTGRYTSPHLVSLTERFAVNGRPVDEPMLKAAVDVIREAVLALHAEKRLSAHPTFFEVTTAAAFELFRQAAVDLAVCEVGLGGRLDATNVLAPMLTAVTSIALDHQQYLGHTVADIAAEKAGIIKPGVPVVIAGMDEQAARVIERTAGERGARLIRAWDGVTVETIGTTADGPQRMELRTPRRDYGRVELALAGSHQIGNAVVAVRILEEIDALGASVPPAAVLRGLSSVRWPGRLERIVLSDDRTALLDAAHNPAGAETLAAFLRERHLRLPLVFSAMRDKDAAGILRALAPCFSAIVLTRASNPRAADPTALAEVVHAIAPGLPRAVVESPREALDAAWKLAPAIVVAGSIFLLGDVMKELGRS